MAKKGNVLVKGDLSAIAKRMGYHIRTVQRVHQGKAINQRIQIAIDELYKIREEQAMTAATDTGHAVPL